MSLYFVEVSINEKIDFLSLISEIDVRKICEIKKLAENF